MTKSIVLASDFDSLIPAGADRVTAHRIRKFEAWKRTSGAVGVVPDLVAYRDHLLAQHAPATVAAHLSTVRGAYRRILGDNGTRDALYQLVDGGSTADRKAQVDEVVTRFENALRPERAPVKQHTTQDAPDADGVRLTRPQAEAMLSAPGLDTIGGVRDTAIIALLLCTGIREAELCALDVEDLRQSYGGELALHIRSGKGDKARLIPYGALDWVLVLVDNWLAHAGITSGPVFRGVFKTGKLRAGRLSVRAVEYITARYPVVISGKLTPVRPHDLRRTYARRLYESGVNIQAIKNNLGHASQKTTETYIGVLSAEARRPPAVYTFDLSKLR